MFTIVRRYQWLWVTPNSMLTIKEDPISKGDFTIWIQIKFDNLLN